MLLSLVTANKSTHSCLCLSCSSFDMAVNLAEPSSPVIADRDSEETKSGKDVEKTVQVVSLLERLKAPKKSDLSRKRKIACNPPKGKKKSSGKHGLAEPKVDPRTRVKEFPNEALVVSPGNRRLFCNACRETLSVQLLTILSHLSIRLVRKSYEVKKLNSRISQLPLPSMISQFIQWEKILQVSSESIE